MNFIDCNRLIFQEKLKEKKLVCYIQEKRILDFLKEYEPYGILEQIAFMIRPEGEEGADIFRWKNKEFKIVKEDFLYELDPYKHALVMVTDGVHTYRPIVQRLNEEEKLAEMDLYSYQLMQQRRELDTYYFERMVQTSFDHYKYGLASKGYDSQTIQEMASKRMEYLDPKRKILFKVLVSLTEICTLDCRDCMMMIPSCPNASHIPVEQVLHDIKLFLSAMEKCVLLCLTGGESFCYPWIDQVLEYLIQEDKVDHILVLTNGTVIPDQKLVPLLQNEKVYVRISDYGLFDKMSQLVSFLEKNNIATEVCTDMLWIDSGDAHFRNKDLFRMRSEMVNCFTGKWCKLLSRGKIYACERACRMQEQGDYVLTDNDGLALADSDTKEELWEKIVKVFMVDYMDACNYCDVQAYPHKFVKAGLQKDAVTQPSSFTVINKKEYQRLLNLIQQK